ncbi:MAG: stability/partitioning determinant [Ahrensia sp.]|nr:stability/partitioning determinant [Ahrensia sp.]
MGTERADLGFADALDDFNPAEFKPKPKLFKQANDALQREEAAKAAESLGFKSREVKPMPTPAPSQAGQGEQRRRRTGRNAQFNLKAKPETIEAYCAIADRMGWGLGETLERAVELLEREYQT